MNLRDLLDELRNNILHDRSDQVRGTESDQLWSDRTLVRYINEAERRLAREALVIRDGTTPDCCRIQTIALQREYQLHASVLAVISAKCGPALAQSPPQTHPDMADLARAGHASLSTYRMPDTYFFDPNTLNALQPGKMRAFDTDEYVLPNNEGSMGVMNLRVYPAPTAVWVQPLMLRVVRMPLRKLTLDALDQSPEIPEEHHLDMLDWAAYLALRIVDVDAGMPERALEFRQTFELHVAEAKKVAMRKLFATLQFGFGRNGFTWDGN
jgi:hypothetical protein